MFGAVKSLVKDLPCVVIDVQCGLNDVSMKFNDLPGFRFNTVVVGSWHFNDVLMI